MQRPSGERRYSSAGVNTDKVKNNRGSMVVRIRNKSQHTHESMAMGDHNIDGGAVLRVSNDLCTNNKLPCAGREQEKKHAQRDRVDSIALNLWLPILKVLSPMSWNKINKARAEAVVMEQATRDFEEDLTNS